MVPTIASICHLVFEGCLCEGSHFPIITTYLPDSYAVWGPSLVTDCYQVHRTFLILEEKIYLFSYTFCPYLSWVCGLLLFCVENLIGGNLYSE